MPYLYYGKTSLYKGKPLFKILCNLKDFGRGRIVFRTIDYYDHPNDISFYRILLAQPEMDEKTLEGRVVAERVYRGLRRKEPVVLSDIAHKPDFRLVPKDEEADFCQWNKIRDFDLARDAERKPKFISMPPLMKKVLEKNRQKRGLAIEDESVFHLPAYKVYQGEFNIEDKVESASMSQYLTDEFATHKNFNLATIPDSWVMEYRNAIVGRTKFAGYVDGEGWEEQQKRIEEEKELRAKVKKLD